MKKQLANLRVQEQRGGATCYVYALSNAINWLDHTYTSQTKPLITRKRPKADEPKAGDDSIRSRAKKILGSAVGEVYGDKNFLKLAQDVGYDNFKSFHCDSIREFCELAKAAVDNGLLPLIIYDVNVYTGKPIKDNGRYEHIGVVSGYKYDEKGRLFFNVGHWGREDWLDAVALAQSNFQLAEKHAATRFVKIEKRKAWILVEDYNKSPEELAKCSKRQSSEHDPEKHGTYKQRLIIAAPNGIEYKLHAGPIRDSRVIWSVLLACTLTLAVVSISMAAILLANVLALTIGLIVGLSTLCFAVSAINIAFAALSGVKLNKETTSTQPGITMPILSVKRNNIKCKLFDHNVTSMPQYPKGEVKHEPQTIFHRQ